MAFRTNFGAADPIRKNHHADPTTQAPGCCRSGRSKPGRIAAPIDAVYGGASLGTPRYEDSVNGVTGHGSDISGKLCGGYQFTPNFALEAGVAGLGHIDNATGRARGHGEYLDAVGIAPLNDKWSLLGRIGVAHVSLNTTNGDDSGNGLKLGLGAQYALTPKVALRAEWERYQPRTFGTRPDIDQYTVGIRVGF